jgi:putative two-component system response regulator
VLHPVQGAQILSGMDSLRNIVPLVRHHHERMDGEGYPDGLVGEEIPLGARLLAVVDAYDSMTSDRPYRSTLEQREAVRRLSRGAGVQWDSRLVALWLECLADLRELAPAHLPLER